MQYCNDIRNLLKEHDVSFNGVSFLNDVFGMSLYLVDFGDFRSDSDVKRELSDIFDIPESWIAFYKSPGVYAIKKKEFDSHWEESKFFDLYSVINTSLFPDVEIKKQLRKNRYCSMAEVSCNKDVVVIKNTHGSSKVDAEALNIPEEAIYDVSMGCSVVKHIVFLDKLE